MKMKKQYLKLISSFLALTLLLGVVGPLPAMKASAVASATPLSCESVLSFESATYPQNTSGSVYHDIIPGPEGHGEYSLYRKYNTENNIYRINRTLIAGHTYNIRGYYYFCSNTAGYTEYIPWFDVWAGAVESFTKPSDGMTGILVQENFDSWQYFEITYTAVTDVPYVDIIMGPAEAYFDDIYIADYTKERGVYVNTDFSDIETTPELPILAGKNASVSYRYDSELGKNIAVAEVKNGWNADNSVYLPFSLKDGVDYEFSITYKVTQWACVCYEDFAHWDGYEGALDSESWETINLKFTGSGTDHFFRLGTGVEHEDDSIISISAITLREVNSTRSQFYDFNESGLKQSENFSTDIIQTENLDEYGYSNALKLENLSGWYQKNYMSELWSERLLVGKSDITTVYDIGTKYNEYAYYGFDIIFQKDVPTLTMWNGSNKEIVLTEDSVDGTTESDYLTITTVEGKDVVLGTPLQANVAYTFKIRITENNKDSSAFGIAVLGTGTFLIGNPYFEAADGTITSDNLYIADGESVTETSGIIQGEQINLRATLDYPLVKGRQYRISYDYKGVAALRFMAFNGSHWESVQPVDLLGENQISLASDTWAHHEAVFTAADDSTDIWFLVINESEALYIDNLIIEQYENEVFDTYKMDFENGVAVDGGCGAVNYTVTTAPSEGHGQYSMKHSVSTSDEQYYFSSPRLLKGHTYSVSLKYYATSSGASNNGFVLQRYEIDGTKIEDYNTETVKDKWVNAAYVMKATTDGEYLALLCKDEIYFDDIIIVDITDISGEHIQNFMGACDDTILLQTGDLSNITYTKDESLGKMIATISYSGTKANEYGWVAIPFVLEEGEFYRVRMTYKTNQWHCLHYNGAIQETDAIDASSEWTIKTWEIKGTGDLNYISIGTNQGSTSISISDIAIEVQRGFGDINNNGVLNDVDINLEMRYLCDETDLDLYEPSTDTTRNEIVDIVDLVRLVKMTQDKTPIIDEGGSLEFDYYKDYYNVHLDTEGTDTLGDGTRIQRNEQDKEAYLEYEIPEGVAELAIQYDVPITNTEDFTVKVLSDPSNPISWQKIEPDDVTIENIREHSWVKITAYFGDLNYSKGLRIELPAGDVAEGIPALRKVQVNALDEEALHKISGYNSELRAAQRVYVDSVNGNDNNSGLTIDKPVKTLEKAFARTLIPGDKILLATGGTYSGSVKISSSGTEFAPITISSYGTGANPVINGFDDGTAITVSGEYVEISNIDFTCEKAYSAVDFYALKDGATRGLVVKNCNFYNINSLTSSTYSDMSNGAVHFLAQGRTPTWFESILVENNTFKKVARTSVLLRTDWAARDTEQDWGNRNLALDGAPVYMSTDVIIRNNKIQQNSGDALVLMGVDGALVEHNTVADSKLITNNTGGDIQWASIWCHSSDNCVFQYNEVYGNRADNGGKDLQAFDIDVACNNSIVQYNYSHDNAGGFIVLCAKDKTTNAEVQNTIVRYNLSVNDGAEGLNVFDITGNVINSQIYNNTVYCGEDVKIINFANYLQLQNLSTTTFTNNVFYSVEGVNITYGYGDIATPQALQSATFNKNVFYYVPEPVLEGKITVSNSEKSNPALVNPGATGDGRYVGVDYKPQAGSYVLTSGIAIDNNGGKDYFGRPVSNSLMGAIGN